MLLADFSLNNNVGENREAEPMQFSYEPKTKTNGVKKLLPKCFCINGITVNFHIILKTGDSHHGCAATA